jgi:hypothetical protein
MCAFFPYVNATFKCLTAPQIEMSGFDFVFGFGF